ncbi:MAG: rRNA maturation RNase YbeY [Chloroflexi bacterium]|nr:MAG: rRNA maturation RNase YbeY [Chloroflexota bacterium]
MQPLKVELLQRKPFLKQDQLERLARAAAFVLEAEGRERAALTILLTDDEEITRLNRQFRGRDVPTDVLAFWTQDDQEGFVSAPEAQDYLGDVVISYERAVIQAEEQGHPVEDELAILVIHGVLHLLGYDDEEEEDRARMWARQSELFEELKGIAKGGEDGGSAFRHRRHPSQHA